MRRWDHLCHWIARHLPRRVFYWALIVGWARSTSGIYSNTVVTELTVDEMIKRMAA